MKGSRHRTCWVFLLLLIGHMIRINAFLLPPITNIKHTLVRTRDILPFRLQGKSDNGKVLHSISHQTTSLLDAVEKKTSSEIFTNILLKATTREDFKGLTVGHLYDLVRKIYRHRFYYSHKSKDFYHALLDTVEDRIDSFSFGDLVKMILMLSKNGLRLKSLGSTQRSQIKQLLVTLSSKTVQNFGDFAIFALLPGQFGFTWQNLPKAFKTSFLFYLSDFSQRLDTINDKYMETSISNILEAIGRLQLPQRELTESFLFSIRAVVDYRFQEIKSHMKKGLPYHQQLKTWDIPNLLTAMSRCGYTTSSSNRTVGAKIHPIISKEDLYDLSMDEIQLLLLCVEETWPRHNQYYQVMLLLRISEIGIDRSFLSATFQQKIFDYVFRQETWMSHRELPQFLLALAKLHYQWSDVPIEAQQGLFRVMLRILKETVIDEENAKSIVVSVLALGDLGVPFETFSPELQSHLWKAVIEASIHSNSWNTYSLVSGLAGMKLKWNHLPSSLQENLKLALFNNLQDSVNFYPKELVLLLMGIDSLEYDWYHDEEKPMKEQLDALLCAYFPTRASSPPTSLPSSAFPTAVEGLQVDRMWPKSEILYFASLIYWLGKAGMRWETLSETVQQALLSCMNIYCHSDQVSLRYYSNGLYGLGNIGASFSTFNMKLRKAIDQSLQRSINLCFSHNNSTTNTSILSQQAIDNSQLIYSLGSLQYRWMDLSETLREGLVKLLSKTISTFTLQSLSNYMYGLSLMTFDMDWTDRERHRIHQLHRQLIQRFLELADEMVLLSDEIGLVCKNQISLYLELFQTFPVEYRQQILAAVNPTLQHLLSPSSIHPAANNTPTTSSSLTHLRFSESLQESLQNVLSTTNQERLTCRNEYLGLSSNICPVDLAILLQGKPLAFISIDGESHYLRVKKQKILHRRDHFIEYLYSHSHPHVPLWRFDANETFNYPKEVVNRALFMIKERLENLSLNGKSVVHLI